MASLRKPKQNSGAGATRRDQAGLGPLEATLRFLAALGDLHGTRLAVGLSGGVDSVVLLHVLRALAPEFGYSLSAIHVHHGISPNADRWADFAARLCRDRDIPLVTRHVTLRRRGKGIEAAAREARYDAYARLPTDAIALAHHLDDQAETVLLNLLRGAGVRGASGMRRNGTLRGADGRAIRLLRPLLEVPRGAIIGYAEAQRLDWVEDESNRDDKLARNFLRLRVAPLLAQRFPQWRRSLARAAAHFAEADRLLERSVAPAERVSPASLRALEPAAAKLQLRALLAGAGLRAPSARKLSDMLRQLLGAAPDRRIAIEHDGMVLRVFRGALLLAPRAQVRGSEVAWRGEQRLDLPGFGGELRFRRVRGEGIDPRLLSGGEFIVRPRSGGERLQPDARRPRRSLKNLFQENSVPAWEREQLPLLFRGQSLVWAPGLGIDVKFRAMPDAQGWVPEWHRRSPRERRAD
jgi:tRNA(Ile)-lysidine synthase